MSCANPPSIHSTALDHPAIRAVDADGHTHSVPIDHHLDHSISLSNLHLHTVSLGALASPLAVRIRQLSLAANSLDTIDLTPLSWCTNLLVLSLNSNRLSTIDLSPLASCKHLERLWLHDNHLDTIDLSPLSACLSLRSLYLEDNSIHHHSLDLSVLYSTTNLRSLRLGGNRLAGTLDVTPLLHCSSLSVFHIDASVSLVAQADPVQYRVPPALRRTIMNIKFVPPSSANPVPADDSNRVAPPIGVQPASPRPPKGKTNPPDFSKHCPPARPSRKAHSAQLALDKSPSANPLPVTNSPVASRPPNASPPIIKVLLIGFRRLARYAAEDSLGRCGKVIIRASDQSVASKEPSLLLDSHLIVLYAPPEKILRQIVVVVGQIPIAVIASERYRSMGDKKLLDLLRNIRFYIDPMTDSDAKAVYDIANHHATGGTSILPATPRAQSVDSISGQCRSPLCGDTGQHMDPMKQCIQHSPSETSVQTTSGALDIELEDIDDEVDDDDLGPGGLNKKEEETKKVKVIGISELLRRLNENLSQRSSRGTIAQFDSNVRSHGKNKLQAERNAVETTLRDLGGYITLDNCSGLARICGLPKCAGSLLFRAAFGSAYEVEAMTPEAGVPNAPMERMKRLSSDAFIAYWNSRLKCHDGEERLAHILVDSHVMRVNGATSTNDVGHSMYGAPSPRRCNSESDRLSSIDSMKLASLDSSSSLHSLSRRGTGDVFGHLPMEVSCPCDAGIEDLIRSFMGGRSSRFGSFALVKMPEAVAIGVALVLFEIRGANSNRVGGRARPVCPREVKESKLNAALIAAEVGIFEGVAKGLSMNHIRSVKGCFATEISSSSFCRGVGCALDVMLSIEEVQHFCVSRKTLLPGVVKRVMGIHCRERRVMSLSEFSIFLHVVNDLGTDGAVDYFFTVIDVDEDDMWTVPDIREFHKEKEQFWHEEGMAVNDLRDVWFNVVDMVGAALGMRAQSGVSRRDLLSLGLKDRKSVLQSLLFVDDDCSSLNIRRTMELSKNSKTGLEMI